MMNIQRLHKAYEMWHGFLRQQERPIKTYHDFYSRFTHAVSEDTSMNVA